MRDFEESLGRESKQSGRNSGDTERWSAKISPQVKEKQSNSTDKAAHNQFGKTSTVTDGEGG